MARCPSGPRSPVSSGRRESWSISAFRPARELEPRPARQWLSKQNLPSGIILAPPVVGHPRRRGAKDDRDEDAVAGVPARLVLHRLFLRGRVRAASISVSHWCVRGLRWAGSVTVGDSRDHSGEILGYGSFGGKQQGTAAKTGGGTRVPRSYRAIYSCKRRGRSVKFARANVCADFSVSGGWGHAVRGGGSRWCLFFEQREGWTRNAPGKATVNSV